MPTLAMSYLRAKTTHQIPRPLKFPICLGPTMQLSRSACLDKPTPCPFKQRSHRQVIYSFQHVAQTNAHAERQLGSCSTTEHCSRIPTSHQRRALLAAGLGLVLAWPANSCRAQEAGPSQFRNKQQGYSLERPQAWEQTSKAGADVLFVNPARKSTTLGVTVSPIRISSLDKFGSLETVRDKLLATEKAKESTKKVELVSERSRKGPSGTLIYEVEYDLDSTRGRKHIFSACAIAKNKLYIVNGTAKCESEDSCQAAESDIASLQEAAGSFDVLA